MCVPYLPASHICMSHVTHMNESCHTYESVMSHTYAWVTWHKWMSHVTHMNQSCHTYDWVMSHIRKSHVTHMNQSCHTYDWVTSHICLSHVSRIKSCETQVSESFHTCECNTLYPILSMWMPDIVYDSQWVIPRMSHATHMSQWVIPHMERLICVNESCHTYESFQSMSHSTTNGYYMWM